jgi:hypothetical protein
MNKLGFPIPQAALRALALAFANRVAADDRTAA